jgi:RND family efflux transporter MFP subunit
MIMTTSIDRRPLFWKSVAPTVLLGLMVACGSPPPTEETAAAGESWSVTAWGKGFEIFAEVEPLAAGQVALAHTHVTRLEDFSPLTEATVEAVLSGPSGEEVFAVSSPRQAGIFPVEIEPRAPGDFDLAFRIRDGEGVEEIRGGRVRVGDRSQPGGIVVAPAPKGATDGGEPLSFLKEEQWRSDFATAWVRTGSLAGSVLGLARARPPAGGEVTVTAPVDGVVRPVRGAGSWLYVGRAVARGEALFQVVPQVASGRSLADLEAEVAALAAEASAAEGRLARLEELLALEAVSRREVEDARTRVATLEARQGAAQKDLEGAQAARQGAARSGLVLRAPFAGEIAELTASAGATVVAGEALARLVRTDLVWLEVALPAAAARRLEEEGLRGVVLSDPEGPAIRVEEGVRWVARSPELSAETGLVSVFVEMPPASGVVLGGAFETQLLSHRERRGVVVPASAVVDDGGVPVVYLQLSGESFVRQEVRVVETQGDMRLVEGLIPGQRLVTRGGSSVRRSSLMGSGQVHGHVH